MLINEPLDFIEKYGLDLNEELSHHDPTARMSNSQLRWLIFCCMAMSMSNTICWAKFSCASLNGYFLAALSWMFRNSKTRWDLLLQVSSQSP